MAIKTMQVICNGVTTTLTYNSSTSNYEGAITAPDLSSYPKIDHYYPIIIKAVDEAGNVTSIDATHASLGNALKLVVKEKVKPICLFTAPESGALLRDVRPTITWTCTDNDSGVNADTIRIIVDGTTIISDIIKNTITGGYQCSYTPSADLTQGSHTVNIDCTDYDGNVALQASCAFVCDTVNPLLLIATPTVSLTKTPSCTFSGSATDATTAPCSVSIEHNSADAINVPVADSGVWSKALTLVEGHNTVVVTAVDRAGNSSTLTKNIELDTQAPTISSVTITPNPVDAGATYVITVNATDA